MRSTTLLLVIGQIVLATGCIDRVPINTVPSGAKVSWGRDVGTTPTQLRIGRYEEWPTAPGRIEAEGYEPMEFEIKSAVPTSRIMCYVFTGGVCLLFKRPAPFAMEEGYTFNLKPRVHSAASSEPEPTGDVGERLRKLRGLYADGLISDDEFKAQRARILKGL